CWRSGGAPPFAFNRRSWRPTYRSRSLTSRSFLPATMMRATHRRPSCWSKSPSPRSTGIDESRPEYTRRLESPNTGWWTWRPERSRSVRSRRPVVIRRCGSPGRVNRSVCRPSPTSRSPCPTSCAEPGAVVRRRRRVGRDDRAGRGGGRLCFPGGAIYEPGVQFSGTPTAGTCQPMIAAIGTITMTGLKTLCCPLGRRRPRRSSDVDDLAERGGGRLVHHLGEGGVGVHGRQDVVGGRLGGDGQRHLGDEVGDPVADAVHADDLAARLVGDDLDEAVQVVGPQRLAVDVEGELADGDV